MKAAPPSVENVGLTIRINPPIFEFDQSQARLYSIVGYVVTELASLEHEFDDLIFLIHGKHTALANKLAKDFPATHAAKIDFLIDALIVLPELRSCGDGEGRFDLNLISYGLEETLAFRNIFIHSTFEQIEMEPTGFHCRVIKFSRLTGRKRGFVKEQYHYSSSFLKRVVEHSLYFRSLFWRLKAKLDGKDVAGISDRIRKGNAEFRELLAFLKDAGISIDDAA
jgi:hypothetical protein